jgi:hypothetical protein
MAAITVPQLEIASTAIEALLPALDAAVSTSENLKGKSGGILRVTVPDPGVAYNTKGGLKDITSVDRSTNEWSKDFTVESSYIGVDATSLAKVTDFDSWDKEVIDPKMPTLALDVHKSIMDSAFVVANTAQVVNSGFGMDNLALAAGYLQETQLTDLVGFLSPLTQSKLSNSAIKDYFLPPSISEGMYRNAKLGVYQNVEWSHCTMPSVTIASANVIAADWAVDTSGVDGTAGTLIIDDNGSTSAISTSTVIKKGSTFTIATVYAKDVQGMNMVMNKTFVVQEDATGLVTGKITLKVGAFAISGAHANVSRLPVATDVLIPGVGATTGTYSVILAFSRGNLYFQPVELLNDGFQATSGKSINSKISISAICQGDINTRNATYRFDTAFVTGAVDDRRATLIYVKQ